MHPNFEVKQDSISEREEAELIVNDNDAVDIIQESD